MSSSAKSNVSSESEENEIAVDIDLKPHPVHSDPNDDIVIISNDYVQFRASRFHLTRNSQFFDGLLGTARPKGENFTDNDEPIHLDYPSTTLSLFLDLIGVCEPYTPLLSFDQARQLIKFVDFAICDNLIDKARAALIEASKKKPFELLVIASERNDVDMARLALEKIGAKESRSRFTRFTPFFHPPGDLISFKEYLLRLTPSFRAALLWAAMQAGEVREYGQTDLTPGTFFTYDWRSIAADFEPQQFR